MPEVRARRLLLALGAFVGFVFRGFPRAYASLLLVVAGVLLEYGALSLMIPLSRSAEEGSKDVSSVTELWERIAHFAGLPPEGRTWLWLFLLLFALRTVAGTIQTISVSSVAKQIHSQLSAATFSRVVSHVPMHEIYKSSIGHYMALAGDDSIRVGQLFFSLLQTASALLSAAIGLAVLYVYSTTIFQIVVAFILACAVVFGFLARRILDLSSRSSSLARELVTVFVEVLNGLRSIRSMAGEAYVNDRYKAAVDRYAKVLHTIDVYNHSSRTLPGVLLLVAGLILLHPSADLLKNVTVIYFFTITTMLIRVLSFLGIAVHSGSKAAVDSRAVFDLANIIALPAGDSRTSLGRAVDKITKIAIENVSCGYIADRAVLSNVTVELKAGRSYALIGASGAGKSTLSDVLLGLLNPMSGELRVGTDSYTQIDKSSLRKKVIVVEQQTRIFSDSVRENISFGLSHTDAEIWQAIEASGLTAFIESLPEGLETRLDYQGANISGGQRQRIGLARAIVRQPDVVILDEATNAIDAPTRDLVLGRLRALFKDRIILFITHDTDIADSVDERWVIDQGRVSVESRQPLGAP